MRKIFAAVPKALAASLIAMAVLPFASGSALAAPSEHFNWGSQINQSECPNGTIVVNVSQKVTGDIDSGTCGNYWAVDDEIRQIQVVQTGTDTFCATVQYEGNFNTVAGESPGGSYTNSCSTNALGVGVVGTFQGGYIAENFTGTLLSSPTVKTKGSIGTYDYGCDPSTGVCASYVDWTTLYFSGGASLTLDWWGWTYHAGSDGSWVNASSGNSGDITGN